MNFIQELLLCENEQLRRGGQGRSDYAGEVFVVNHCIPHLASRNDEAHFITLRAFDFNMHLRISPIAAPGQPTGPGIVSTTAISNLKCTPVLPTRVRLDVKPGSPPNVVNIKSNGVLPMAILSSSKFDATQIDPASLRFADTGTEVLPANWSINDGNGDGLPDLEANFRSQQTGIACDTTPVSITANHSVDAILFPAGFFREERIRNRLGALFYRMCVELSRHAEW